MLDLGFSAFWFLDGDSGFLSINGVLVVRRYQFGEFTVKIPGLFSIWLHTSFPKEGHSQDILISSLVSGRLGIVMYPSILDF